MTLVFSLSYRIEKNYKAGKMKISKGLIKEMTQSVNQLLDGKAKISYVSCKNCNSIDVVRNGTKNGTQQWLCKDCGRSFVDNGCLPSGRFKPENIAAAVYMYHTGASLNDIVGYIKQRTGKDVSDAGIYKWVKKYTKIAVDAVKDDIPKVGNTWVADETVIRISGKKYWVIAVIDQDTRFALATRISRSRTARDIQIAFERAKARAGKSPKAVLTDGYVAYPEMVGQVFGERVKHIASKPFEGKAGEDTNVVERWNSSLKEKHKVSRHFKSPQTAKLNLDGWILYYNYMRPHMSLDDETPAKVAKLKTPFENWQDVVYTQKPKTIKVVIKPERFTYRKRRKIKPKGKSTKVKSRITPMVIRGR